MSKYISDLQIAPAAVMSAFYPPSGNGADLGHMLLVDPASRADALRTILAAHIVLAGPLVLENGSVGMLGWLPVFTKGSGLNTTEMQGVGKDVVQGSRFWGFVVVAFDFAALMNESGVNLNPGYLYSLTRAATAPDVADNASEVISSSAGAAPIADGERAQVTTFAMMICALDEFVPSCLAWCGMRYMRAACRRLAS